MKKLKISFVALLISLLASSQLLAQVPVFYPIFIPNRHCGRCCECDCDTTKVTYKPIQHWDDVRHIFYTTISPINQMNISLVSNSLEQSTSQLNLTNNAPTTQIMGYEFLWHRSFIGMDMGFHSRSAYQSVNPELQMRTNAIFNLGLNVGHHLVTTKNLRFYVMGRMQFNHVSLRLRKENTNTQQAWHRFLSNQSETIPYDRLVEGLLTSDKWISTLDMGSSFFATQLRFGLDYRIKKVKIGLHAGYSFQLSDKQRNWNYHYQYEDGDAADKFKITQVPVSVALDGVNAGFSIGYLLGEVAK